jgi:hypothetical protein
MLLFLLVLWLLGIISHLGGVAGSPAAGRRARGFCP